MFIHLCIFSRSPAASDNLCSWVEEIATVCSAALTNSNSVMLKYLFRLTLGGDRIHLNSFLNAGFFPLFNQSSDRITFFFCLFFFYAWPRVYSLCRRSGGQFVTVKQVFLCQGHPFDCTLVYISKYGQLKVFKLSDERFFFYQTMSPMLSQHPHVGLTAACLHRRNSITTPRCPHRGIL